MSRGSSVRQASGQVARERWRRGRQSFGDKRAVARRIACLAWLACFRPGRSYADALMLVLVLGAARIGRPVPTLELGAKAGPG